MQSFAHQLLAMDAPLLEPRRPATAPAPTSASASASGSADRDRATQRAPAAAAGPKSPTQHIPCKFFRAGLCSAGDNCSFSHSLDAMAAPVICKYHVKGTCKFGSKCALAHVDRPPRHAAAGSTGAARSASAKSSGGGPAYRGAAAPAYGVSSAGSPSAGTSARPIMAENNTHHLRPPHQYGAGYARSPSMSGSYGAHPSSVDSQSSGHHHLFPGVPTNTPNPLDIMDHHAAATGGAFHQHHGKAGGMLHHHRPPFARSPANQSALMQQQQLAGSAPSHPHAHAHAQQRHSMSTLGLDAGYNMGPGTSPLGPGANAWNGRPLSVPNRGADASAANLSHNGGNGAAGGWAHYNPPSSLSSSHGHLRGAPQQHGFDPLAGMDSQQFGGGGRPGAGAPFSASPGTASSSMRGGAANGSVPRGSARLAAGAGSSRLNFSGLASADSATDLDEYDDQDPADPLLSGILPASLSDLLTPQEQRRYSTHQQQQQQQQHQQQRGFAPLSAASAPSELRKSDSAVAFDDDVIFSMEPVESNSNLPPPHSSAAAAAAPSRRPSGPSPWGNPMPPPHPHQHFGVAGAGGPAPPMFGAGGTGSPSASTPLCATHAATGRCPGGCGQVHGLQCPLCGMHVLHPFQSHDEHSGHIRVCLAAQGGGGNGMDGAAAGRA
ncbi:hypothetical protein H9P43_003004 [Blastocladiella emersonii ATCC 22665]|nr:hypothetical protein H9P43_003004 [Blastocladiella emersonii ATCC 22665]